MAAKKAKKETKPVKKAPAKKAEVSKKPMKSSEKKPSSKSSKPKKGQESYDDMGIVIVDEDLEYDKDKENEERRAYLEEARSQEAFD